MLNASSIVDWMVLSYNPIAMDAEFEKPLVIDTGKSRIVLTCKYAEKTPDGFWEHVYEVLKKMGVFDF